MVSKLNPGGEASRLGDIVHKKSLVSDSESLDLKDSVKIHIQLESEPL